MAEIQSSLAVFDYSGNKLCDLYDSQNDIAGQAYSIKYETNMKDGIKQISFNIPYMIDEELNFRWKYLRSEYLIRLTHGNIKEWFIANKPTKTKSNNGIIGSVVCYGKESILKTKNIYKEFNDENGIGTVDYLMTQILAGSGWRLGHADVVTEADGTTEKIRSLSSSGKKGALDLIANVCNLFRCYPVYRSDTNTVDIYAINNRDQVIEGRVGKNLDSLSVTNDSSGLITRMYVEGEYGDDGYVGIDSVNPSGLSYIFNFDYYIELGLLTAEQQTAYNTYLRDIANVKAQIEARMENIISKEDKIGELLGQCVVLLYYKTNGFDSPTYTYGEPTAAQRSLAIGDKVLILQNNKKYRYDTIKTTPDALLESTDYGLLKFVKPATGSFGVAEIAVEAKEKQIANLQKKIDGTTKTDRITEYTNQINELQAGIDKLYNGDNNTVGMYAMIDSLCKSGGHLAQLYNLNSGFDLLREQQDDVEATFIAAMGDLIRDGYWSNTNYITGQEQHLYDDAVEMLKELSRPKVSYKFSYHRTNDDTDIPIENIKLNAVFRIEDDELETNDLMFVTKITIGIDDKSVGNIETSNNDISISSNDLGSVLSRMSQLADLIDQKNSLYDRAQAIARNKTFYTDRLNGQINVLTNQLLSTASNWYTDEQGNILFVSADGGSAMMLTGAGFMISNQKDENDQWIWRTFGTGEGFTADEIVAGFISADRIEAGSIATSKLEPDAGNKLVISGNPAFSEMEGRVTNAVIELMPGQIQSVVGNIDLGYTKTYIQSTDPRNDSDKTIHIGDYWVINEITWQNVKTEKWNTIKNNSWKKYNQEITTYCWNGSKWIRTYDKSEITTAYTRITQTQDMIRQEAERANGAFVKRTSVLQTADQIVSEATKQAKNAADGAYIARTATIQTANELISEASKQAVSDAGSVYIAQTKTIQSADDIISEASKQAVSDTGSLYIARTTTIQDVNGIISKATKDAKSAADGAYIKQVAGTYTTAESIVTAAQTYVDEKVTADAILEVASDSIKATVTEEVGKQGYAKVSGITINSSGVKIEGNKYIQMTSGGSFKITSGTFKVDSDKFFIDSTTRRMWMIYGNPKHTTNDNEAYTDMGWEVTGDGMTLNAYQMQNNTQISIADQFYFGVLVKEWVTDKIYKYGRSTHLFEDKPYVNRLFTDYFIWELDTTAGGTLPGQEEAIRSGRMDGIMLQLAQPTGAVFKSGKGYGGALRFGTTNQAYYKYDEHDRFNVAYYFNVNYDSDTGEIIGYSLNSDWAEAWVNEFAPATDTDCWILGAENRPFYESYIDTVFYNNLRGISSREAKENIYDLSDMGDAIDQLTPVSFNYKKGNKNMHYGLIYEDTVDVLPGICNETEKCKSISYIDLVPVLLKEIQSLRKRVKELEEK